MRFFRLYRLAGSVLQHNFLDNVLYRRVWDAAELSRAVEALDMVAAAENNGIALVVLDR